MSKKSVFIVGLAVFFVAQNQALSQEQVTPLVSPPVLVAPAATAMNEAVFEDLNQAFVAYQEKRYPDVLGHIKSALGKSRDSGDKIGEGLAMLSQAQMMRRLGAIPMAEA